MKFSIKDCSSKCDQPRIFLQILSQLLKKSLTEDLIFFQCNKTNNIHERALRIVYEDKKCDFETLFKRDKFVSIDMFGYWGGSSKEYHSLEISKEIFFSRKLNLQLEEY